MKWEQDEKRIQDIINLGVVKSYCKLEPCPHGFDWKDRVILEILHIEQGSAFVKSPSGCKWYTDNYEFCKKNGERTGARVKK